jgi:23S rRNA (uracil1939-C5)-methyltransferase
MSRKNNTPLENVQFFAIAGGGQAIGEASDGKKVFAWNALPGETARVQVAKKKSSLYEGVALDITAPSDERITPHDADSFLSTSPWQMMTFEAEQRYKAQLISDAFRLHRVNLPRDVAFYSDNQQFAYRNKVEFSWYGDTDKNDDESLDLAFFRRGSKGKIPVDSCSLLPDSMMKLALAIRDMLHQKRVSARSLKTLLIRCNQAGECVWQLYTKDKEEYITADEAKTLPALGGEIIYSDPHSPASRITERLAHYGTTVLEDNILGVPFRYATEGFFQVNIPVYEQALRDMQKWIPTNTPVVDMYSGVGSIGLTIGGEHCTLIEIDENAVREMNRNIAALGSGATAVLAASEKALEHISPGATIIVDPPRAGLHADVVAQLLTVAPKRIIYLSCNPVTQARDVALLAEKYTITHHQGYNFFPRTPHIEHLVVLDVQ